MQKTKYLFDENKMTPEGMVSVSQLQTFLSCKKKWEYNYIENLKPRVERSYLTIGKLCHKGMQVAMQSAWKDQRSELCEDYYTTDRWKDWYNTGIAAMNKEWVQYMESVPLLDEEIPDIEQMYYDAVSVFTQAFEEFEPWKYEVVTLRNKGKDIPALELHFKVPCIPTKGMHGYIDAILEDKETGFIWCVDYKFRKSLSPDDDEAFNIQNAVYSYVCKKMGIDITGTLTWQHVNTPASDPAILKDGTISKAKIKTTWDHYAKFCEDHGQDPANYTEMIEKLADIEWFRATYEYRNDETIENIWNNCVVPVAKQVRSAHNKSANNYRSLYPWNCKMCQYQSLCQAELRNYDADAIRDREYVKR
jgi:ATP-dependent helicase/DNAse subunit B